MSIRRYTLFSCLSLLFLILAGCQGVEDAAEFEYLPLFGDGANTISPAVAEVNGLSITEAHMELRMDELPAAKRNYYSGPEGQRLLLKDMVDQVILVQRAVELKLYNEQSVARTLISERRITMDTAMRKIGILRGKEPTQEEIQDYFIENRESYKKKGMVLARHVECASKQDADLVYEKLLTGDYENRFLTVVRDFSTNLKTLVDGGDLGWFNKGGYIPKVQDPNTFTTLAYDLQDGFNPPIRVGDSWHVVEIQNREYDRSMTFGEAQHQVKSDMRPNYQKNLVDTYLQDARKSSEIVFHGIFAPGEGMNVEQLFARARAVKDTDRKLELYKMLYTDYPESDRADDALFLSGNLVLDDLMDRREGAKLLTRLLKEYPDSELAPDTQYILENMGNSKAINPTSIEDLRK
ncbi:MAG: peptidyl-prolyl cis-trans isomerase [Gemmatimonadales bacterium]|nr:peptidyl-prolyl cis-trans isomerase [Gemmatimonadales bacterium]